MYDFLDMLCRILPRLFPLVNRFTLDAAPFFVIYEKAYTKMAPQGALSSLLLTKANALLEILMPYGAILYSNRLH